MKVLIEASGGIASGFMIHALHQAGHDVVASDISEQNAGSLLADDYIQLPRVSDPRLWKSVIEQVQAHRVDIVIPSLDDMLLGWDAHREQLSTLGIQLVLSPKETLTICLDKWLTYQFFLQQGIPTPKTSLTPSYALFKPRQGRGAKGVVYCQDQANYPTNMDGLVSQEYLDGVEYTIDVLCNTQGEPVMIVPRTRLLVVQGKAVNAQVVEDADMIAWVKKICSVLCFVGLINVQCFKLDNGDVLFTEINPRVASGMALSFAASGNWLAMLIAHYVQGEPITPAQIQWNMKMYRHYTEVFAV